MKPRRFGRSISAILVRELVELLDALLQLRDLAAQPLDLLDQPVDVRDVGHLVRHCPPSLPFCRCSIARFHSLENPELGRARSSDISWPSVDCLAESHPKRACFLALVQGGTMTEPLVGIIMGSSSDWETMRHAAETLDQLGVPHETKVVSAHRTPKRLYDYAHSAKERGLKVDDRRRRRRGASARHDGVDDRASGARRADRKPGAEGHG